MKKKNKYWDHLEPLILTLPGKPGVYQYFDESGKIIYVGKAKNLKKRVSSYFTKEQDTGKLRVLVKKIATIEHIVVDSEHDALLLENNLIKKYQPRYNVMLKDDKTFPWICIKNERFPRVFPTRNVIRDNSEYFGPYASVRVMNTLLDLVKQLYPLRSCKLNLTASSIQQEKHKVCLEYHIGNCLAPCIGEQSEEDYLNNIDQIRKILKGNLSEVHSQLKTLMGTYAEAMEFEKAQIVKEKIDLLAKFQSKSLVVNPSISNVDVFSISSDDEAGYVNYMKVVDGAIIQAHTVELKKKLDETDQELLAYAIMDLRKRFDSGSNEVFLSTDPGFRIQDISFIIPKIGDKKKLVDLSLRNVKYYRLEKQKQKDLVDPERHSRRIMETMRNDLRMKETPIHIECIDNSNTQGNDPVSALVVFRNGRPAKKDYRHFLIKSVEGPNDFASMEEVVLRRYKRLLDEEKSLPQLLIVDGGKGQLSAALKGLEKLGLRGKITLVGIAKKLEEIYFPEDSIPLYLDKKSESLKIIQHMRDEAHRFSITHHRKKREKTSLKNQLLEIQGIGPASNDLLLKKLGSVKKIKAASLAELQEILGKAKGKVVFDFFKKEGS